jgi:hypothetical protein
MTETCNSGFKNMDLGFKKTIHILVFTYACIAVHMIFLQQILSAYKFFLRKKNRSGKFSHKKVISKAQIKLMQSTCGKERESMGNGYF